jgi:hypothetical protein
VASGSSLLESERGAAFFTEVIIIGEEWWVVGVDGKESVENDS